MSSISRPLVAKTALLSCVLLLCGCPARAPQAAPRTDETETARDGASSGEAAEQEEPGGGETAPEPGAVTGSEESLEVETGRDGAQDAGEDESGDMESLRREMVETQIIARGVTDPKVIEAMLSVPRHQFVPPRYRSLAYADHPLPIGEGQTISQPLIVALMSKLSGAKAGDKVLEIGTGSGYHAAVLSELGATVYTIEIVEPLGRSARLLLGALGYEDVHVRIGDGYRGWPEHAPFDAIVVTAAPPSLPPPLLEQLAVGGRMVVPVGEHEQQLEVIVRTETGYERERHGAVRFVPMTGEASRKR